MTQLSSRDEIRSILATDRDWAAYALADLEPGFFEHGSWFRPDGEAPAVALLYQAFTIPVLITVGAANLFDSVWTEIETVLGQRPAMYLSVRPDVLRCLSRRYNIEDVRPMLRMRLNPARGTRSQANHAAAMRLSQRDLDAVQRLFSDGQPTNEVPQFFVPPMLDSGAYWGIHEGDDLVAVAGTHILSKSEGVGAIGNVYTRRDRRGRGYGSMATRAVVAELLELQLATIILNVHAENHGAQRIYQRMGFDVHCDYFEAIAKRKM